MNKEDIEQTTFEPGLNEDVIKRLSKLKKEPLCMIFLSRAAAFSEIVIVCSSD